MAEYIEREKAIEICQSYYEHCLEMHDYCGDSVAYDIRTNIQGLPIADVVEVKHGEWGKEKWCNTHQHICSNCFATVRVHPESCEYKYCPYCSAKMDGRKEGADNEKL